MPHTHDGYRTRCLLNVAHQTVIANPITPRVLIALHRLAHASRIIRDARFNERQDAALNWRIKPCQRLERRGAILNLPSQVVF